MSPSAAACKIIIDCASHVISGLRNLASFAGQDQAGWRIRAARLEGKLLCLHGSVAVADAVSGQVTASVATRFEAIVAPVSELFEGLGWDGGHGPIRLRHGRPDAEATEPLAKFEADLDEFLAEVTGLIPGASPGTL